ncbi:Uncharacterized protein R408 [Durusdinium trenchii]|uniref:Uncharacterized protein R408 n=1 Tax=Durusdinium trenchii TaxID=1381693 RepID=A0ABP0NJJ6_9DINO
MLRQMTFISLGSFCGVAQALESLGLRRCSMPLDWTRSSAEGVTRLVRNGFEDFLQASEAVCIRQVRVFPTTWGGFWHQALDCQRDVETLKRRRERFLSAAGAAWRGEQH